MEQYVLVDLDNHRETSAFLAFDDSKAALEAKRIQGGTVFKLKVRKCLGHLQEASIECPTCGVKLAVYVGDGVSIMTDIHATPDGRRIHFECGHATSPQEAIELMKSHGLKNPMLTLCHPRQVRQRWGLRSPVFGWWSELTVTTWGGTIGMVVCSAKEIE